MRKLLSSCQVLVRRKSARDTPIRQSFIGADCVALFLSPADLFRHVMAHSLSLILFLLCILCVREPGQINDQLLSIHGVIRALSTPSSWLLAHHERTYTQSYSTPCNWIDGADIGIIHIYYAAATQVDTQTGSGITSILFCAIKSLTQLRLQLAG